MNNDKLMIGWSEADITPELNGKLVPLSGQYYARYAKGIHSRLKNVVVAISSGNEYFITGSFDNVSCRLGFHDAVRAEVAKLAPEPNHVSLTDSIWSFVITSW